MRIIAGAVRGKQLQTPPGLHTRPTTDRTKESVFNIIQFYLQDARVLDLFAGSGQLGLECLSRGATHCTFCDNDRAALQVIRKNIAACGMEGKSKVVSGDFLSCAAQLGKASCDVIMLDPPYGGKILNDALRAIQRFDILAPRGIIVCESAREDVIELPAAPYSVVKQYRYGTTTITTLTREEV